MADLWDSLAWGGGAPRLADARPMADPYFWGGRWVVGGGEDGSAPVPVSADWNPETRTMRATGWTDAVDPDYSSSGMLHAEGVEQWLGGAAWSGDLYADARVGSDVVTLSRQLGEHYWERADYRRSDGQLTRVSDWSPFATKSSWKWFASEGALAGLATVLTVGAAAAAGLLGGAAAGAAPAAVAAESGVVVGGSGLTAGATASGSGLGASIGSGLTLAAPTGTGAGLAIGTGSNIIGAGIGASLAGVGSSLVSFGDAVVGAGSIAPAAAPAGGGSILQSMLGKLAPSLASAFGPSIAQGVNQALAPKQQPLSLAGYSSRSVVPLLFAAAAVAAAVYMIRK